MYEEEIFKMSSRNKKVGKNRKFRGARHARLINKFL